MSPRTPAYCSRVLRTSVRPECLRYTDPGDEAVSKRPATARGERRFSWSPTSSTLTNIGDDLDYLQPESLTSAHNAIFGATGLKRRFLD
jgi:hypothetical protein